MLSARIFDHLDYTNIRHVNLEPIEELLASLPKKPFKVISIHDCFRCCLADSVKLMDVIRSAYHEVFVENDQFENLSQQIGGINMYQENIVTKELLDSPHAYYFCQ